MNKSATTLLNFVQNNDSKGWLEAVSSGVSAFSVGQNTMNSLIWALSSRTNLGFVKTILQAMLKEDATPSRYTQTKFMGGSYLSWIINYENSKELVAYLEVKHAALLDHMIKEECQSLGAFASIPVFADSDNDVLIKRCYPFLIENAKDEVGKVLISLFEIKNTAWATSEFLQKEHLKSNVMLDEETLTPAWCCIFSKRTLSALSRFEVDTWVDESGNTLFHHLLNRYAGNDLSFSMAQNNPGLLNLQNKNGDSAYGLFCHAAFKESSFAPDFISEFILEKVNWELVNKQGVSVYEIAESTFQPFVAFDRAYSFIKEKKISMELAKKVEPILNKPPRF